MHSSHPWTKLALLLIVPTLLMSAYGGAEEFRLCTGNPGKTYHAVGTTLAEAMPTLSRRGMRLTVVATEGSRDNLQRLASGDCQGAITQGDVMAAVDDPGQFHPVTALYKELSLLICHHDAGVDEIADLLDDPEAIVAAGHEGSGALATWRNFQTIEPAYGAIKLLPVNGMEGASLVASGHASCLFEVIAPRSNFISQLNDNPTLADILSFASITEEFESFTVAGEVVYSRVQFDDETYPALGRWGDPTLLAITAYLVVTRQWADAHPALFTDLSQALLTSHADIETVAYGEERPFSE